MLKSRYIAPVLTLATLAACGEAEEPADTSYEEQLPIPTQSGDTASEPVPTNDSIEGGADEQVDQQYSGDNTPVVEDPEG
ncbi:MAG: hypothetical protein WA908_13310, partial [Pontixanthobacter sp.]